MMRGAALFLALLALPLGAQQAQLVPLSQKFLETGAPAARQALVRFASEKRDTTDGALARLVLGIRDYQEKDFSAAVEQLGLALAPPTELADYAVYYQALALSAMSKHAEAARLLAGFGKRFPAGSLVRTGTIQRAESLSLSSHAREALELLSGTPATTAADCLLLAQVAERAGELVRAAQAWQRVYYEFPASPQQPQALAATRALRARLGARYPQATAAIELGRVDKLAAAQQYRTAYSEYRALSLRLKGLPREQAAVRQGTALYHLKANLRAYRWLAKLRVTQPEAAAERLYYLAACARRLQRPEEFTRLAAQLGKQYAGSPWYEEALNDAGNYYLVEGAPEQYVRYYRTLFETFPQGRYAAAAQWKVAWQAYLDNSPDARRLIEDHIRRYPSSPQLTAAVFWLGRLAEAGRDWDVARSLYTHLITAYPHYYHSLLARDRVKKLPPGTKVAAPPAAARLLTDAPVPPQPPSQQPPPELAPFLGRARLLDRLGLTDLAQGELRFCAESKELAYSAGLELAEQAAERGDYYQAIRFLKRYTPGYLAFPLESMPRRYWELLFPMPWRDQIESYSRLRALDPYLVAGLIRQESEFNPGALSRARARGLMQIMLPTGRRLGRNLGMTRVTPNLLYVPETSLKLGTLHLRRVLDQYEGRLEPALAGYNAGEHRADKWLSLNSSTDPAAFVESIPFSETRNYVQAVLRTTEIYRKLYGSG